MSDTPTCPNCSATLPAGATFCTSCGTRMGEVPAQDATQVVDAGLTDTTQVFTPPPPPPPAAAPPAPWQPAEAAAPAAPAPWTPPPAAPAPPAEAPVWQAPPPAPGAPPVWAEAPAPAWGAQPGPMAGGPGGPAGPAVAARGGSVLGGLVGLVGGALTLVGLFTAWIGSDSTSKTVTGWDLASGDPFIGLESKDPYLILALGIGAVVLGLLLFTGKARTVVRIAAVLVGATIIGVLVRDWLSIVDIVKNIPGAKVTQEFGYYLGIAGGALTIVAALIPGKK